MVARVIQGGAIWDVPTAEENATATMGHVRTFWDEQQEIGRQRELEHARGIKRMEITAPVQPNANNFFQLGPDEGLVWSVKLVSAALGSSGNFAVYKASASGDRRRLVGQVASAAVQSINQAVISWGSDQFRLKHGEGLYLLCDQAILGIYVTIWQVPAEMEWKLL